MNGPSTVIFGRLPAPSQPTLEFAVRVPGDQGQKDEKLSVRVEFRAGGALVRRVLHRDGASCPSSWVLARAVSERAQRDTASEHELR